MTNLIIFGLTFYVLLLSVIGYGLFFYNLCFISFKDLNDKNTIFCGGEYIYGRNKKSMKCHCGGGNRNIYNAQ